MNRTLLICASLATLLVMGLAGCNPVTAPAATQTEAGNVAGSTSAAAVLRNATFAGILPEQLIMLTDGRADYTEEGSGTPFVQLIDTLAAAGDLDGDGRDDSVGLLVDYTTGSADFVYLAALLSTQGEPVEALLLGDRTPVRGLTIADDHVIVDFVGPGQSNAACCPTWNVRAVYAVEDGKLVERSRANLSEVILADLDGTAWRLVELGADQPLLPDSEITLAFDAGQVSGSAGCNAYSAALSTPEELPQSLAVGPIAVTTLLCEEPIASQEATYLDLLRNAVAWRYDFGQLAITYKLENGVFGDLIFAP